MQLFRELCCPVQIDLPLHFLLRLEVLPFDRTEVVDQFPRGRQATFVEVEQHIPETFPQSVLDSAVLQDSVVVLGLRAVDPIDDGRFRNPEHLTVGL